MSLSEIQGLVSVPVKYDVEASPVLKCWSQKLYTLDRSP